MSLYSFEIPQADNLEDVITAVISVNNGAKTFADIARAIGKVERQGRYYRLAAELLGFIRNKKNTATLTPLGEILSENPTLLNPVVISAVLHLPLAQQIVAYLELHPAGISRRDFGIYMQSLAPAGIGRTMIPRRVSTILSWLKSVNVIADTTTIIRLNAELPSTIPIINLEDDIPLIPITASLQEYQTVERRASDAEKMGVITIFRNEAAMERANQNHSTLVNLVAERIRLAGAIPKRNKFIDLATTLDSEFIFEMKSTTETNVQAQIRKGVSQLYEYRYLQGNPNAKLVLVIQNPLTTDESWFKDYLESDRDIHLVWDGDGVNLYGSEETRNAIPYLNLQ